MTLRRRLLVTAGVLVVSLVLLGGAVLVVHRGLLIAQVDRQLQSLASAPRAVLILSRSDRSAVALAELYVGRITPAGRLVTLLTPASDPELEPQVTLADASGQPVTRPVSRGTTALVRLVAVPLGQGAVAVFAVPLTGVDAAGRGLALALGLAGLIASGLLAAMLWWVFRLGLRPFAELTSAAEALTRGEARRRVEPGPAGTEAARLAEAFNTMVDATAASDDRLRRFVADASHELRTPLTTLRGYAELYQASSDPAVRDDAVRRIAAEAGRMRRIVDDLFLLNDLDAGGLGQREPVALGPVLDDIAADARVVQPDRRLSVKVTDGLIVSADRDRLVQAITALVANALRHTPTTSALALRAGAANGWVRLEVQDAGPGIPPEQLPHVFERLYRGDPGRGRGQGGSGLGLAIVASIVAAHGGHCGVVSDVGTGSTFWISLPEGNRPGPE